MVIVRFAATGFGILPNFQIFILYYKISHKYRGSIDEDL